MQTNLTRLCECGCGKPPRPGQRYAYGHRKLMYAARPCGCGCGKIPPLDKWRRTTKYIPGHEPRITDTPFLIRAFDGIDYGGPGCWKQRQSLNPDGYGYCTGPDGERWLTHRAIDVALRGPLPPDIFVLHHCDVPSCCRPSHLWRGTLGDNNRDCRTKGRGGNGVHIGTDHPRARLDPGKVREIRQMRASGWLIPAIADHFGVNSGTISYVLSGRTWSHVT